MSIPEPARIAKLPRDKHGYPVPWFVAWINGVPDVRVIRANGFHRAIQEQLCWICGKKRQPASLSAFVIGPMCAVNRVAPEPPSHVDCATYAAMACPFLTTPRMGRRENRLPEGIGEPGGISIRRNPGVALVWVTRRWQIEQLPNGLLWMLGNPVRLGWFAEGRDATREEVIASIESGLPILQEIAQAEGPEAVYALDEQVAMANVLIDKCWAGDV